MLPEKCPGEMYSRLVHIAGFEKIYWKTLILRASLAFDAVLAISIPFEIIRSYSSIVAVRG